MKQTTFYIYILTVILSVNTTDCTAKGKEGSYTLKGLALSVTGDTLKNQQFLMHFKDTVEIIETDSYGYYKTKIHWAIPCPSGLAIWQMRRVSKKYNPKYIFFSYKDSKIKIKNDWKSFVYADFNNLDSQTKKVNLLF